MNGRALDRFQDAIMSALIVVLLAACYFGFLFLIAYRYWRRFKRECPEKTFNFRIADIYAAIAGLMPTTIITASIFKNIPEEEWWSQPGALGLGAGFVLGISQLTGLFVARLLVELPQWSQDRNTLDKATLIVAGGWIGLFFPLLFATFFWMLLPLLITAPFAVLALVVIVLLIAAVFSKKGTSENRKP